MKIKMRLTKLFIKDYKSIKKLSWVVDERLSCLVGQNESGKSNIIEVLEWVLSPEVKTLYSEIHTNRSSRSYINGKTPKIEAHFSIDSSSYRTIKKLVDFYLDPKNSISQSFVSSINEIRIVSNDDSGTMDGELYFLTDKEYNLSTVIKNPTGQVEFIKKLNSISTKIVRLDEKLLGNFEIPLKDLNNKSNQPIVKLLKLAGVTDINNVPKEARHLRKYLKQVNKQLNKDFVRKFYTQDKSVMLNISHDSGNLTLEITDDTESEYDIDERSDGFKYFFNLLIDAASINKANSDVIFILDEPGSKLHPSGQRDLLRYLEELSEKYRVIYTTHSPFMINRLFPRRVKIVEKSSNNGTEFKLKGFSKNWHPLRSSLGLNLSDSFYYSEKALIVEGPEDVLYIGSLLHTFYINNKVTINTDMFSFIDSGGEGNLPAMVQIMIEEDRPILVLMDSDSPKTYNRLKKKIETKKLKSTSLCQINEFHNKAISIEDLLPKKLLINAVENYIKELLKDKSLQKRENSSTEFKFKSTVGSYYKNDISQYVKNNFKSMTKREEEWLKDSTPISKVGIASHFDKLLKTNEFNFKTYEIEFRPALKLIKRMVDLLKLK